VEYFACFVIWGCRDCDLAWELATHSGGISTAIFYSQPSAKNWCVERGRSGEESLHNFKRSASKAWEINKTFTGLPSPKSPPKSLLDIAGMLMVKILRIQAWTGPKTQLENDRCYKESYHEFLFHWFLQILPTIIPFLEAIPVIIWRVGVCDHSLFHEFLFGICDVQIEGILSGPVCPPKVLLPVITQIMSGIDFISENAKDHRYLSGITACFAEFWT